MSTQRYDDQLWYVLLGKYIIIRVFEKEIEIEITSDWKTGKYRLLVVNDHAVALVSLVVLIRK